LLVGWSVKTSFTLGLSPGISVFNVNVREQCHMTSERVRSSILL